ILGDVETLCDRVVILRKGEVVVSGRVRDLLRSDVRRVEGTLGDAPESLAAQVDDDGIKRRREGEHVHVEIDGEKTVPKVLATALQVGARVVEVVARRETLEDLFMRRAIGENEPNRGAA